MKLSPLFENAATIVAHYAGRPLTFIICCTMVVLWALAGPVFGFSDTWQLLINTTTTIITFLMVFLIQSTQNRDGVAIQTKLDELIRAGTAQNAFVGIERLTEDELESLRKKSEARARSEDGGRKVRTARTKRRTK